MANSRIILLAVSTLALCGRVRSADAVASPVLTRIADIRALSREEAQKAVPVKVRGVVTLCDGTSGAPEWLVLDDGAQSIFAHMVVARQKGVWEGNVKELKLITPGDVLEMDGVSHPGSYAPMIMPRRLVRLGREPLPPARKVAMDRLLSGAEDGQRVELEGVIQSVTTPPRNIERSGFVLRTQEQTVRVSIEDWPGLDPSRLLDAEVRVRGVFSPTSNYRSELVALRIRIMGADDCEVLRPPPLDAFEGRRVSLDRLQPFSPAGPDSHRCVTQGTVTFCAPGDFFFVQDGKAAVRVHAPDAVVKVGERVEIAGFVDMSRMVASLTGAVVRSLGDIAAPEAAGTTAQYVLTPEKSLTTKRGMEFDLDGHLLKLKGTLRGVEMENEGRSAQLQIEMKDANTTALLVGLSAADAATVSSWVVGSALEFTGVCELVFAMKAPATMPNASSFRMWLRSPADVRILQTPPWWTPQRLTVALVVSGLALLLVFGWSFTLHRTLRKRTAMLEETMSHHRNAELEFESAQQERRRLAVDLHDGLQQMITGVSYRLEAGIGQLERDPSEAQAQLTAARRALASTKTGLRDCLLGLRQVEEGPGDFAALLRHSVETNAHWPPGAVSVETAGEAFDLSRDVMGSLLMLVQEAVGNALLHGAAPHVDLRLHFAAEGLELTIEDSGKGFNPQSAPGTRDGHYGLEGMRQRMRWLGGTVEITSHPDGGTRVCVRLPRDRARTVDPTPPSLNANPRNNPTADA